MALHAAGFLFYAMQRESHNADAHAALHRLTNAFSKNFENHCHMVALYAAWYNFVRILKTLRVTPAMEAGATDRVYSVDDLVGRVDGWEAAQKAETSN